DSNPTLSAIICANSLTAREILEREPSGRNTIVESKPNLVHYSPMDTKTGWNNPICVCLIAATLGLFGNMITTGLQIRSNQRLAYEQIQSDLILQATKDPQHAKGEFAIPY